MSKFLIIQTAFIGDVVLATAIAEKLNQHVPGATIDILIRKGNESLFADHPFIGKVWVWDKKKNKFRNLLQLAGKIRAERYEQVINLQRYFSSGLFSVLSGAKVKRGFDKNPLSFLFDIRIEHQMSSEGTLHETQRNQLLIEDLTDDHPAKPRLYPSAADRLKVSAFQSAPYICCAPSSVWFTKQYPEEYWIAFLAKVPPHVKVYLLGGPGDAEKCDRIISASANMAAMSLCGQLSFLESTALMEGALMNYVNDSAPLHFSSAVNAPVTAIFCSTVTNFGFGPLSETQHIVEIEYPLYCRPCGLHGHKACPQKHFKCAHDIPHNKLIEILHEQRH